MTATISADAQTMIIVNVPDGSGGYRQEFQPAPPEKPKARKARPKPDPLHANPEASAQQLRQFIERLERLEEEKAGISDDIRDVKSEAKACGWDVSGITAIIKLRKLNPDVRRETEMILDTYKDALGIN